jgi:maleate isomerase
MFRGFIEARGIEVPVMGSFNHENDIEVARITEDSIREAVRRLVTAGPIDAVFVSCTSLRVAAIAESLEREVGVPVTSSNHALAWHCLRLAGYREPVPGFGSLFRLPG